MPPTTPQEVDSTHIVALAMSLVRTARHEILATMNLVEELSSPLPREYFFLLQEKIQQGIILKRLAFGNPEEFERFQKQQWTHERYQLRRATTMNYKRMLLIDQTTLLFALSSGGIRKFYYSTALEDCTTFHAYFFTEWEKTATMRKHII